jgi:hypothetical protein
VLFAQFLLRVAQVCLGLVGDGGTRGAELSLDRGDRLAGDFADGARHAGDLWPGRCRTAEFLDP